MSSTTLASITQATGQRCSECGSPPEPLFSSCQVCYRHDTYHTERFDARCPLCQFERGRALAGALGLCVRRAWISLVSTLIETDKGHERPGSHHHRAS